MVNIVSMQISPNKLIQTATLRIYRAQLLETSTIFHRSCAVRAKIKNKEPKCCSASIQKIQGME